MRQRTGARFIARERGAKDAPIQAGERVPAQALATSAGLKIRAVGDPGSIPLNPLSRELFANVPVAPPTARFSRLELRKYNT